MLAFELQRFAEDKTEKATPRRRQKSIQEGNIPKSRDLVSSISFLVALFVLKFFAQSTWNRLTQDWTYDLSHVAQVQLTAVDVIPFLFQQLMVVVGIAYPFVLFPMIVGIIANYAQVKFVFLPNLILPKFSRLNPLTGFTRIFGVSGLVQTLQSLFKLLVISSVAYFSVQGLISQILNLPQYLLSQYPGLIASMIYSVMIKAAVGLIVLAGLDYAYQRFDSEKRMKMSKEEVKRERKDAEGNPEVKQKIRKMGFQIASKRMMQQVPKADVVVTNPTHFAVCLKYERGTKAPIVTAKGSDEIALRIRSIAHEHAIPIVENKPLARELYQSCDLDDPIPMHLFKAVAELLAYVYIRRKMVR